MESVDDGRGWTSAGDIFVDGDDENTDRMEGEVREGELCGKEVGDFEEKGGGRFNFEYFHGWDELTIVLM